MTNMGSLVEPLNKDQYRNNLKEKCVGLFSHSDQPLLGIPAQSGVSFHADLTCVIRQTAAQTLACQVAGNSARGGQRVFTFLCGHSRWDRWAHLSLGLAVQVLAAALPMRW